MTEESKTIVAVATPAVSSAIAIIRISGKDALRVSKSVFFGFSNTKIIEPRKMYFGKINAGKYNDECLGVFFENPKSYTGEDVVEFYCHGSYVLASGIVRYLVEECGLSYAEGGDFTYRAFKNGKLDLTEAEGVYDMIMSQTEAEVRGAYSLLSGELKNKIIAIQDSIIDTRANTEVVIDYPEEDIEEYTKTQLLEKTQNILTELDNLLSTYRYGKFMRLGVRVALLGKPNVGKSSLMNSLLGYDRAIVTNEKGTTRDTLTEQYIYNDLRFILTDTAGIRKAVSLPEQMGVERSELALKESDIIVFVVEKNDLELLDIKSVINDLEMMPKTVVVFNKADKFDEHSSDDEKNIIGALNIIPNAILSVSAKTGLGIDKLKQCLFDQSGYVAVGGATLNNERQYFLVNEAKTHVKRALDNLATTPIELISSDLYDAQNALGKITGIIGSDAVADKIFKKFCVGK